MGVQEPYCLIFQKELTLMTEAILRFPMRIFTEYEKQTEKYRRRTFELPSSPGKQVFIYIFFSLQSSFFYI